MLFPTVIFIFPAMFLVILGPAMLSLKKVWVLAAAKSDPSITCQKVTNRSS